MVKKKKNWNNIKEDYIMIKQTAEHMQNALKDTTKMIEEKNGNCIFLKRMTDKLKRFNYLLSMKLFGRVITDVKEMEAERKREAEIFKKALIEELGKTEPKMREKIVRRIHRITVKALERPGEEVNG